MAELFQPAIRTLEQWGVLDVILPFLLIFTIIYALFLKTNLLGVDGVDESKNKKYAVVLALVIAAMVVMPHAIPALRGGPGELRIGGAVFPDIVFIINNSIPSIAIWIVGILMVMMITGVFTEKGWSPMGFTGSGFIAILAIGLIAYLFGSTAGYFGQAPYWLRQFLTGSNTAALIVLLVFGLIIKYVTGEKKTGLKPMYKELSHGQRLMIDLGKAARGEDPAKWEETYSEPQTGTTLPQKNFPF